MASQDELIVRIGADFEELKKGLKESTKGMDKMAAESKKSGRTMATSFAKATIAVDLLRAGAIKASNAVKSMTIGVVQNAREQQFWAQRLQVSTESFSALVAIGKRFGVDMETVGDAMKDLNERVADAARGNKTYERALQMVGLRSKDLIKLNVDEQFIKVADAIGKMTNAGDQNFATAELMADAGFRMLEVFRLGEKQIKKMTEEVRESNEALDKVELKKLEEVNKKVVKMTSAFTGLANAVAIKFAGSIDIATKSMEGWAKILKTTNDDEVASLNRSIELTKKLLKAEEEQLVKLKKEGESWFGPSIDETNERVIDLGVQLYKLQKQLRELKKEAGGDGEEENLALPGVSVTAIALPEGQELSLLEQYLEQQSEIRRQAREAEIYDKEEFNRDLYASEVEQAERITRLWEQGYKGRMMVAKDFFGSMSVLMQTENRKMFEIGKAAAIANATITTIESAQKSFNSLAGIPVIGPALGAAAAAAAIAGGVARIQQIQSTTMGGGGGVGGVSAAAATAGGEGGAEVINQTNVDVSLQGSTFSRDDVRGLINEINEQADDNFVVRAN
jgi:hypothetical protein